MTIHILEVDGYAVGDRLLEGAMFRVSIKEDDGDFAIVKVEKPADTMRGINYAEFFDDIRKQVQDNLDHLRKYAKSNGRTIVDEFDQWQKDEPSEPRIALLNEV